jgi:hypothetical protein
MTDTKTQPLVHMRRIIRTDRLVDYDLFTKAAHVVQEAVNQGGRDWKLEYVVCSNVDEVIALGTSSSASAAEDAIVGRTLKLRPRYDEESFSKALFDAALQVQASMGADNPLQSEYIAVETIGSGAKALHLYGQSLTQEEVRAINDAFPVAPIRILGVSMGTIPELHYKR